MLNLVSQYVVYGSRHLLEEQRSLLHLITRPYKRTSSRVLQILTDLMPLNLQIALEAEYSFVHRHQIIRTTIRVHNIYRIFLGKEFFQNLFKNFMAISPF